MGLDITIRTIKNRPKESYWNSESLGDEVVYFRKFYPLQYWVQDNCKEIKHDVFDLYKITKKDLLNFVSFFESVKGDEKWWDGLIDYSEYISILKEKLNDGKSFEDKFYYYEWSN